MTAHDLSSKNNAGDCIVSAKNLGVESGLVACVNLEIPPAAKRSFFSGNGGYPLRKPKTLSATGEAAVRLASMGAYIVPLHGVIPAAGVAVARADHKEDWECACNPYWRKQAKLKGLPFTPCVKLGKIPNEHQWEQMTINTAELARGLWTTPKHQFANIGLIMGARTGLMAVDVDGELGFKSLAGVEAKFGPLPKTLTTITGSGGRHYIYRIPEGVTIKNSAKKLGANVLGYAPTNLDTRGDGGQVVVAPSIHPTGNAYRWADGCSPDDIPFAEISFMPAWLVQLCEEAKAKNAKASTRSPTGGKGKPKADKEGAGEAKAGAGSDMASDTPKGLAGFLASIGDHDGGDGFDGPIRDAALSYFGRNGIDAPADEILAMLHESIDKAYRDPAKNRARYDTDEYLIGRIEQARAYIEANPPQRKSSATLFDSFPEGIAALNAKTAIVHLAGKTRLLRENADGTVDFPSKHDAELTYLPWKVMTKKKETRAVSAPLVDVEAPLFPVWMQSSDRREYASVTFNPSEKSPQDGSSPEHVFNLWRGFSIEPAPEGVGSWRLYARHVFNVIANADEAQFLWVCAFMADMLQNPATKPGSAIVLSGIPGCGKTIICMPFKRILETHMTTVSDEASLAGNFNAHMAKALLVNGEEAFFAGNHQVAGKVKHLITGSTIMLEHKGIDKVEIPNFSRFIYTSNEGRIVFVDKNDRRNYVSGCGAQHVGDKEGYFDPLVAEIKGDGPAAMMRDLLALDISDVALNLPPRTEAFGEQVAENMTQAEKWLMEVLETGAFPQRELYDGVQPTSAELEAWEIEGLMVLKDTIFDSFNSRVRPYGGGETDKRSIGKWLSNNITGLSDRRATLPNGARPWVFSFPPLGKLREMFTRETHIRLGSDAAADRREVTSADLRDPFFGLGYVLAADHAIDVLFGESAGGWSDYGW
jgi:hypothetical protein